MESSLEIRFSIKILEREGQILMWSIYVNILSLFLCLIFQLPLVYWVLPVVALALKLWEKEIE